MLALRMSRKKMRSGKPSLPLGRPAGIHVDDDEAVLRWRNHGMSEREDAVLVRIFAVQGDVAAAVGEILAVHRRDILVAAEAFAGDAGACARTWRPSKSRRRTKLTTPAMASEP